MNGSFALVDLIIGDLRRGGADVASLAMTAVNVAGTVKSPPLAAVPSASVNVTVVASFAGWSNVAVTVTDPADSATVVVPDDNGQRCLVAGCRTVTVNRSRAVVTVPYPDTA